VVTPRGAWRRLAGLARGHARRCGCPACDKTERDARTAMDMPVRHPERLTRELPESEEEQLAGLAAELWPDDEYAQIISEIRREGR
jgi:hypothetical protein